MRARELEEALRVARGNVKRLQQAVRLRQQKLGRCRERREELDESFRIVQAALDPGPLPTPWVPDVWWPEPRSDEGRPRREAWAAVVTGAICLSIWLLLCAADLFLAACGFPALAVGLNLLWHGRRALAELRGSAHATAPSSVSTDPRER